MKPNPDHSAAGAQISRCYAHTLPGKGEEAWEPLIDHLNNVAARASDFADSFGSKDWGYLAGLWHDLGKYRPEFQRRLRGSREQTEHAGVGAALAASKPRGIALAFAIAGHHSGLANRYAQVETSLRSLHDRLADNQPIVESLRSTIPSHLVDHLLPAPPDYLSSIKDPDAAARRLELWIRFIFSAVVDADRLETERFYSPGKRNFTSDYLSIGGLLEKLNSRLAGFTDDTLVNRLRASVLRACRTAADNDRGVFTLTAPTGSGKTLSSMAFALNHAVQHDLKRVIVVVPYTTIIEQNAQEYARVFGSRNVIEHHSNLDEDSRSESDTEGELIRRMAVENWDAPVVITTNVQFFESLFSNHPGRCRKLHNIARSVIVLDEAQNMPTDYLNCTMEVLQDLVRGYSCSVVLMTATQPALKKRETLPFGLEHVEEIIPESAYRSEALERVTIHWPGPDEVTPYSDLAGLLAQHQQVLAIVHLRKDARTLAQRLPAENRFHLSALMCAAHRTQVLNEVKRRLAERRPVRLVTTQLIEAGVDIDFPVVYRALAGLDSIAQAAGRCNREGKLHRGHFVVFRAETKPPAGALRKGLETTEALLNQRNEPLSLGDESLLEEYFRALYFKCDTDRKAVQVDRRELNFASVAQKVRLIEDDYMCPLVVRWGGSHRFIRELDGPHGREARRRLQQYTVNVPERDFQVLANVGAVERIDDSLSVLTPVYESLYDETWGLVVDPEVLPNPASLVV